MKIQIVAAVNNTRVVVQRITSDRVAVIIENAPEGFTSNFYEFRGKLMLVSPESALKSTFENCWYRQFTVSVVDLETTLENAINMIKNHKRKFKKIGELKLDDRIVNPILGYEYKLVEKELYLDDGSMFKVLDMNGPAKNGFWQFDKLIELVLAQPDTYVIREEN